VVEENTWIDINLIYYTGFHLYLRSPQVNVWVKNNRFDNYTSQDQLMQITTSNTAYLEGNEFIDIQEHIGFTFIRLDEA